MSPHSGRQYSRNFLNQSVLSFHKIRASEDFYVDELLKPVIEFGSLLLEARFPRSFVDLNRSPKELDEKLIMNIKETLINARTSAGLGVIPRVVGSGLEIYRTIICLNEVNFRLKNYYFPYHHELKKVINHSMATFGFVVLLDFHSMPHSCITNPRKQNSLLPQIVLGDCFGTSCDSTLSEKVFNIFSTVGFRVKMNDPFSGGFITKNYGTPKKNIHSIQIEIDRSLYMNETDHTLHSGYLDLKKKIKHVICEMSKIRKQNNSFLRTVK